MTVLEQEEINHKSDDVHPRFRKRHDLKNRQVHPYEYDRPADLTHRVVVLVASLSLLGPAFATWSGIIAIHFTGLASVVLTAGSLVAVAATGIARTERALRRIEIALLLLATVGLIAWATSTLIMNPAYGTDEAAYEQYAAQLLLHRIDPYGANLLPALRQFQVPIQYATYTVSGGIVSTLGYPALPVLLAIPFILATHGVQSVPVADITALIVAMLLSFLVLPKRYKSLSVLVVVGLPILFGYALAGVNVILALPFLVVVAWRFTETGRGGALGARGVAQAVCFGLAMSVQQLAWFVAPFVVLAIWLSRRKELDRKESALVLGKYNGIAFAAFAIVNAGFIVVGPWSWFRSVLGPLVQHAIPYGQGLIDLPVFVGAGGGNLELYTLGALLLYGGTLLCFWRFFDHLWRVTFILPALVLFFPTRSLGEYWMTMVLVWCVSLFAVAPGKNLLFTEKSFVATAQVRRRVVSALVIFGSFIPGVAILALAVSSSSPFTMRVIGFRTNGQFQRVWELRVAVANHSNFALRPHFASNSIGQMTPFWHRRSGPAVLGPHKVARYVLVAPDVGSMPGITQPFQLDAVTAKPQTISVTGNVRAEPYRAWIYQSSVNQVQSSGQAVDLTVQLRSPFGGLVRKPGVSVALGQIVYRQSGLTPGEAVINGHPEGESPVVEKTNYKGEATFRLENPNVGKEPIYFQAWVVSSKNYPFGYSEIVDILWSEH